TFETTNCLTFSPLRVAVFRSILSVATRFMSGRYRLGRRSIYAILGVVFGAEMLLLFLSGDAVSPRSDHAGDLIQRVSVEIERVDPATNTIHVAGDLVGIMGIDVVVTPETWIGIDR